MSFSEKIRDIAWTLGFGRKSILEANPAGVLFSIEEENADNIRLAKKQGIKPVSIGEILDNPEFVAAGYNQGNVILSDYPEHVAGTPHNWMIWKIDRDNRTATIQLSGCEGEYYPHKKPYQIGLDEPIFTGFVVNETKLKDGIPITLQQAINIPGIKHEMGAIYRSWEGRWSVLNND